MVCIGKSVTWALRNVCADVRKRINENSISLAILPWAHSYGLSAELHNFMQFGGAIALMESVDTLAEDFLKVRPTYLIAVPKVFNKIYDGIQTKMHEEGGIKKMLFDIPDPAPYLMRGQVRNNEHLSFTRSSGTRH